MKAPFPYFGGKAKIAPLVWRALGDVAHYIEPFCGSCAILLARPARHKGHMETIVDADCHVANAWRAMQFAPDEVARWCDWPVNHADLNARRKVLNGRMAELKALVGDDPQAYDAELAGYWIWCQSTWIGSGLTRKDSRPQLGDAGRGVHALGQTPHLAHAGKGVHATSGRLNSAPDRDVREPYNDNIYVWFRVLSERLRYVRVVCGDWSRVCGGDWQDNQGVCGVFFDPPYSAEAGRDPKLYSEESATVAHEVADWALERGPRRTYRIVLAGYYEEHERLLAQGWRVHRWKAQGGYGNQGAENANRHREALFMSPHCLAGGDQLPMFERREV